ncbi:N-acyl-D-amino-acid deacylase [Pseudomonas syringae pv. theae ICMP 3923]|nr:amidohydrolase family protein [Pseudomonas syringae]EPM65519.1 N-acyl-D-amino-acid deacylase [Pseudomonas syringae pv. theae ICMP 3923]KPZ35039.1 hypothetical protein AN901_202920 [Pseudomonas syringae pv. theae]MBL3873042.1 hypothetical protein [Pseudomonas syringae pv. theae]GKQ33262.1 D-aminoacylase [Pseudomonas syringae pv. theae]GKS08648.1 D-aminoacylase [Pseudomonas syringae pv. theae]
MSASEEYFSVVIQNGNLIDGVNKEQKNVDIGISGTVIAKIAPGGTLKGTTLINASGSTVCPGFVDIHSHADYTILLDGRGQSSVIQGVTSIVPGNCGHGIAPLTDVSRELVPMNIFGWRADSEVKPTWTAFGGYMDALRERGVGPNVFPLVAHGAIRLAIAGFDDRALTDSELKQAQEMLHDALASGAVGLSTGLEYAPGISSTTEELVTIAKAAQGFDAVYATHCRNRSDHMAQAAQEAVDIAISGNMRLQMSHYIRRPYATDKMVDDAWAVLDSAKAQGVAVKADVFPFDYGPTPLAVLIPPSMRKGSREDIAKNLQDVDFQARIAAGLGGMFGAAVANGMVDSMYIACDGQDGSLIGLSLGELARKQEISVEACAVKLLADAGQDFYCVTIVENWVRWEDLVDALSDSDFFVMGDGATGAVDGPASTFAFALADWGYTPRYLSQFVRDLKVVSLEDAVFRLATGPAQQFGLKDRGTIEIGKKADIVVFDLETVGSEVTPTALRVLPTGISHVLVNGEIVVDNFNLTNALPGQVGLTR